MSFQDLFSTQAKEYAQYRPSYPPALYSYLASLTPQHNLAWDVGTGNGQAAVSLAEHYQQVLASDGSEAQIAQALPHPKVQYKVGREVQAELASHSVDLITVAQAIHWFQFDTFFAEVKRVASPGAVCAAWAYDFHEGSGDGSDAILRKFYFETLGPYWAANNKLIWEGYKDIPFPFKKLDTPRFHLEADWNFPKLLGYFSSWSATARFKELHRIDPLDDLARQLLPYWPNPLEKRRLRWRLHLLAGLVQ